MGSFRARLLCLSLAVGVAACAKPAAVTTPPPAKPAVSNVTQYLPLLDATVFAYDTANETGGGKGLLVMEIRRRRSSMGELVVAGRVRRLEIDETGIRHATGGWLLRPPLKLGATWQGDFGTVEVRSIDKAVSVPAGDFSACLETVEALTSSEFSKKTTTVFCPDVGIVTRVTEAETSEGYVSESMRLRSHGPRFDAEPR